MSVTERIENSEGDGPDQAVRRECRCGSWSPSTIRQVAAAIEVGSRGRRMVRSW